MLHLPDRPRSVTTLDDDQRERVGQTRSDLLCPTCGNRGSFQWYAYASREWQKADAEALAQGRPRPKPLQVREFACLCEDQHVLSLYMTYWGIGLLYQRMSWRDIARPEVAKLYEMVVKDLAHSIRIGQGLYIQGSHGLGKTLLCALIAKDAIRQGMTVRFITFVELLARHESTYKGNRTEEAKRLFWDEIQNVNLLVIDDLGKESLLDNSPSPAAIHRMISELFRQRNQSSRPTYVSSNLFAHKAMERYGTDVGSLLGESFEIVTLEGEDYRSGDLRPRQAKERALGLTRPIMI